MIKYVLKCKNPLFQFESKPCDTEEAAGEIYNQIMDEALMRLSPKEFEEFTRYEFVIEGRTYVDEGYVN